MLPLLRYIVLSASALACLVPSAFGGNLRDRGNRADYLVISPSAYLATAETLASFRAAANGLLTMVVPMDTIGAQFGQGVSADQGLKAFLQYALTAWGKPAPRYIVFAGNVNVIPSHVEKVDIGIPTDSAMVDQWFVQPDVSPGLPSRPAAALGRLPAWDAVSLSVMIQKTMRYESGKNGAWASRAVSLADNDNADGGTFVRDASSLKDILAAGWPDTLTVHTWPTCSLYREPGGFRALWDSGAAIVAYNGHGGTDEFSNSRYFTTRDVDSLVNGDQLSVCFIGACNQRLEARNPSSVPVHLLEHPLGGSVAAIGPGGISYENVNTMVMRALFQRIAQPTTEALGTSFAEALGSVLFGAWMDSLTHRMNYMGDPALRLRRETAAGVSGGSEGGIPGAFQLEQNWPNPFNPATSIAYTVHGSEFMVHGTEVKLVVYDILGREVAVLVDERQAPGRYTVRFDAGRLASGVYLYRLQAGSYVETRRMVLLK